MKPIAEQSDGSSVAHGEEPGGTAATDPAVSDQEHFEDLRIAVVMNGGVSLAVWIGGVTHELNRLVRGESCYGPLLALTENTARVDVISGTSAGGLNGAFLAMALAHDRDLISLRDLWLSKGSISALLRQPHGAEQPSLLQGDEYFLPELRDALGALWTSTPTDPQKVPIELRMTTTLLRGQREEIPDDFGSLIPDIRHRGIFKFSRGGQRKSDPFAETSIVDQLALAARSTAAFPVAFEASFCPVDEETQEPRRVDMARHVDFKHSHFVIDGGVLQNKPLKPALRAIQGQRSDRKQRRVLAYVVPDPESTAGQRADEAAFPPSVAGVALASLGELPRVESISQDLHDLRNYNRLVRERLRSRVSITSHNTPEECEALAKSLFAAYRAQRVEPAINYIVEEIERQMAEVTQRGFGRRGRREWLHGILRRQDLPWVPAHAPGTDDARAECTQDGWRWGLRPAEHSTLVLLDLLDRVQRLIATSGGRVSLKRQWDQAFDLHRASTQRRGTDRTFWRRQAEKIQQHIGSGTGDVPPDATANVEKWAKEALESWREEEVEGATEGAGRRTRLQHAGRLVHSIADSMTALHPQATQVLDALADTQDESLQKEVEELGKLVEFFLGGAVALPRERVIARLLMFEVIHQALGGRGSGVDQVIELIQVSGDNRSPFGGPREAGRKLAGIQLGHFGAFYKRSWRANDWMYGRLDAASRLIQIVMNPERLRTVSRYRFGSTPSPAIADQLEEIAVRSVADPEARELLSSKWDRAAALRELDFLNHPEALIPEYLPVCSEALVRRLHLETLQSELVVVARAVAHDLERGGDRNAEGTAFLREFGDPNATRRVPAEDVERLFGACNVRSEKVGNEVGSDRLTAVAGQTLAVAVAAGQATDSGLGGLRGLLKVLRAPTLLFHLMARNILQRSRSGAAVNAAALTAGLTLVGVHYLVPGSSLPKLVLTLAWIALGAGLLLFAFVRPGLVAIVCTALVGVGGFLFFKGFLDLPVWTLEVWRSIAFGLASIVFFYLLGSLSWSSVRRKRARKRLALAAKRKAGERGSEQGSGEDRD